MEKEIWLPVIWWEWKYEISNIWRIKSKIKDIIMKPKKRSWYNYIAFKREKWYKNESIHRLVLKHFSINPENKPQVNHKNWIRDDNRIENLERCTVSENVKHWYNILWRKWKSNMKWKFWKDNHTSKKVKQYSIDWILIKEWYWIREASRYLWILPTSICNACKWKSKTSWWFIWKY